MKAISPPLLGRLYIWNSIGAAFESAGEDEQALAYFMDAKTLAEKALREAAMEVGDGNSPLAAALRSLVTS